MIKQITLYTIAILIIAILVRRRLLFAAPIIEYQSRPVCRRRLWFRFHHYRPTRAHWQLKIKEIKS